MEMNKLKRTLELVIKLSVDKASQVLSKMLSSGAAIEMEQFSMMDVQKITSQIEPHKENVLAATINLKGELSCQVLFLIEESSAYVFTDSFLGQGIGTTKECSPYVESTVQEMGNILASAISNVFSKDFGVETMPTPPNISHDPIHITLENFLNQAPDTKSPKYLSESKFKIESFDVKCRLFLLIEPAAPPQNENKDTTSPKPT